MLSCNEIAIRRPTDKQSEAFVRRHDVETMTKCDNEDAGNSVNRFRSAFRQRERSGHHAKAQCADARREHEAMLLIASAKSYSADNHCQGQPHLVDDGSAKQASS